MQKKAVMLTTFKKIILIFLATFVVMSCSTTSTTSDEQPNVANSSQQASEPVKQEKKEAISLDYSEGLVPPTNQGVLMPYYVQDGDNLIKIAKKIYGDRKFWKKISEINKLIDPHKIYAGDVIYYEANEQSKLFAQTYESAPKAKIIVKKGDTLTIISKVIYGKTKDWRVLWKENPHILNPDRIKEGVEIYFRSKVITSHAYSIINLNNIKNLDLKNKQSDEKKTSMINKEYLEKNDKDKDKEDIEINKD